MRTILLFCTIPYLLTGLTGCASLTRAQSLIQTVTKARDGTVTTTTAPMPDQKEAAWAQQIEAVLNTPFIKP
jgi:uncharacterized protein YceK